MPTEVWFRNPHDYIRELVEVGESRVAWDRGLLRKKGVDPLKHAELYFGSSFPWRVLTVGTQGSAEYAQGSTLDKPVAVYPTWAYGEDSTVLEEMFASPMGEDIESCTDTKVRPDERPVLGQEHRIIITEMPRVISGPGRTFIRYLRELMEEYPKAIVHLHGLYSWKVCFGMGFHAADVDPRTAAKKGNVHTPAGSLVKFERMVSHPQWAAAMGMKPSDLEVPRNRCIYNIKSALWAGLHYDELYKFKTRDSGEDVDHESSDEDFKPPETASALIGSPKAGEGDKFICNTCSLQDKCKYFREGSVCTVPGAEPVRLASMFKSRNVEDILEGLSTVVAASANRLQHGMRLEVIDGESSPEVTKMLGQVFDQGQKLAKLVDPQRFSPKGGVTVNVGSTGVSIEGGNPRQLAAQVVQGFVAQGIPRDQITPKMIQGAIEAMANPDLQHKAVTAEVSNVRDEPA